MSHMHVQSWAGAIGSVRVPVFQYCKRARARARAKEREIVREGSVYVLVMCV